MIYSVAQHKEVPITITKDYCFYDDGSKESIRYDVYAGTNKIEYVGYLKLEDIKNGVKVSYIENQNPNKFRHFGQVADQIEVEHCLKRGIENPYICSVAAINTHIKHFKRGKRFVNEGINVYLNSLLKILKKGEHIKTGYLGENKMYMPVNLVNEIKNKIKINSLLKGVK